MFLLLNLKVHRNYYSDSLSKVLLYIIILGVFPRKRIISKKSVLLFSIHENAGHWGQSLAVEFSCNFAWFIVKKIYIMSGFESGPYAYKITPLHYIMSHNLKSKKHL